MSELGDRLRSMANLADEHEECTGVAVAVLADEHEECTGVAVAEVLDDITVHASSEVKGADLGDLAEALLMALPPKWKP